VNLSRAQLGQRDWAATVARILRETGMDPLRLQLEVTESLAAQDTDVQQRLHELKALGITLALDDFGTGYSSLASLHLLPVDTVKIDRSFVSQSETSHHHRVLIEATVKVAQSLGMSTVAEGIETAEQAAVVAFGERAPLLTPARQEELADIVEPLTGTRGQGGVLRLFGMANWLLGRR
jgi:EAL domain-containing protein (putative c-di-GMP-specific phosphodiesterase class I)